MRAVASGVVQVQPARTRILQHAQAEQALAFDVRAQADGAFALQQPLRLEGLARARQAMGDAQAEARAAAVHSSAVATNRRALSRALAPRRCSTWARTSARYTAEKRRAGIAPWSPVRSSQPLSRRNAKSRRPRAVKSITGNAMSSITSIQRRAGSNSMQSKAATPLSRLTTLSRCRSPWPSRTRPACQARAPQRQPARRLGLSSQSCKRARSSAARPPSRRRPGRPAPRARRRSTLPKPLSAAVRGRVAMKIAQQRGQLVDVAGRELARREPLAEQRARREPAHPHRIFQHRARDRRFPAGGASP